MSGIDRKVAKTMGCATASQSWRPEWSGQGAFPGTGSPGLEGTTRGSSVPTSFLAAKKRPAPHNAFPAGLRSSRVVHSVNHSVRMVAITTLLPHVAEGVPHPGPHGRPHVHGRWPLVRTRAQGGDGVASPIQVRLL